MVRLLFEPSGRPDSQQDYYLTAKENLCVVCGKAESYIRWSVRVVLGSGVTMLMAPNTHTHTDTPSSPPPGRTSFLTSTAAISPSR